MGHLNCQRMNTKALNYNSFHVEVLFSDIEKVMCPDLWPERGLIIRFRGRLHEAQIWRQVSSNDRSDSDVVQSGEKVAAS